MIQLLQLMMGHVYILLTDVQILLLQIMIHLQQLMMDHVFILQSIYHYKELLILQFQQEV